jgi:hypothetical protein
LQDFLIYQVHVGSFSGRNDGITVKANTATFVDLIDKLGYIAVLGSMPLRCFRSQTLTAMSAGQGRATVRPICLPRKTNMPQVPARQFPNNPPMDASGVPLAGRQCRSRRFPESGCWFQALYNGWGLSSGSGICGGLAAGRW